MKGYTSPAQLEQDARRFRFIISNSEFRTFNIPIWMLLPRTHRNPHSNNRIYYISRERTLDDMARKQPPPQNWNLVNYTLTSEELVEYTDFMKARKNDALGVLHEVFALGYKVSITWVDSSNSFCVSVTGGNEHPDNPSSTITSWSDDLLDCMAISAYKVLVVFNKGAWRGKDTSRRG